jgi:hypothetical protein
VQQVRAPHCTRKHTAGSSEKHLAGEESVEVGVQRDAAAQLLGQQLHLHAVARLRQHVGVACEQARAFAAAAAAAQPSPPVSSGGTQRARIESSTDRSQLP